LAQNDLITSSVGSNLIILKFISLTVSALTVGKFLGLTYLIKLFCAAILLQHAYILIILQFHNLLVLFFGAVPLDDMKPPFHKMVFNEVPKAF